MQFLSQRNYGSQPIASKELCKPDYESLIKQSQAKAKICEDWLVITYKLYKIADGIDDGTYAIIGRVYIEGIYLHDKIDEMIKLQEESR